LFLHSELKFPNAKLRDCARSCNVRDEELLHNSVGPMACLDG